MQKTLLICLLFPVLTFAQKQDNKLFDFSIKKPELIENSYVDSISITDIQTQKQTNYLNQSFKGQSLILQDLQKGKYLLKIKSADYLADNYPFVICSKCKNEVDLTGFPNQKKSTAQDFKLVALNPSYIGGDKQLQNDFVKNFSTKEIEILKSIKSIIIDGFITKDLEICDISFSDNNLTVEISDVLYKGIANLKNWYSARVNGKDVDGKFVLKNFQLKNF